MDIKSKRPFTDPSEKTKAKKPVLIPSVHGGGFLLVIRTSLTWLTVGGDSPTPKPSSDSEADRARSALCDRGAWYLPVTYNGLAPSVGVLAPSESEVTERGRVPCRMALRVT